MSRKDKSARYSLIEPNHNTPVFEKTLLLITYDEHGGWYDHVLAPGGIPPGDRFDRGFLRSLIGKLVQRGRHSFAVPGASAATPLT
jgi:phospholipase C